LDELKRNLEVTYSEEMDIQAREAELSCDAVQLYGIHSETILEVLLNYSKAD
jgi:hypothetical protein